jgi:transposase-like protein
MGRRAIVAEILDGKNELPDKRPNFPREFKRELVEQTFDPGVSVSVVARRNDTNTSLLFRWRRQEISRAHLWRRIRRMRGRNPTVTLHRYFR